MNLYTIGFTKKTAEAFFSLIQYSGVDMLIDIRLNNNSQLAGFSKGNDLEYFLSAICGCKYTYDELFAPTKDLMDGMKQKSISFDEFQAAFRKILDSRKAAEHFVNEYQSIGSVCLLCSEEVPDKCHRRIVAEYLADKLQGISIIHLV